MQRRFDIWVIVQFLDGLLMRGLSWFGLVFLIGFSLLFLGWSLTR
jgi:hypothetical protein